MLDKETKQRINSARQILVGKVPDPKAQVEQITNALIYKFMDDMDRENEELDGKAQFLAGELKEFSWGRLMSRQHSGLERWDLYTRALSAFAKSEQIPELFRTIFKDAYLPYRDPETLNLFLKEINGFSYSNSENLGNAFEYLLSILGSQGDAGQFRTPRHIIDFIVEVVNPQKTDRILDPACGTAGFLISSYKHIWRENSSNYKTEEYIPTFAETESLDITTVEIQKNGKFKGDKLNPDDRKRLSRNIVGYDISPDMVRLSLVNLYLHGFSTPKIYEYDTLTYEDRWGDNFDIILANPPFMTPKGGIRPHKLFQVSANRAEVLFVDYIAEHFTLHGKAGIIVPEGIIFQSANAYKALRKMLVDENYLYAVVSLPAGVFQPYSGVKTSILFLDKQLAKRNDEILFVKVENDGFDLGAQRRRIDKNDLPQAFETLQGWQKGEKTESKLALWVKKERIAENGDYNLTVDRYRETVDYSKVKWPMVKFEDVCTLEYGSSLPKKKRLDGPYPVMGSNGVSGYHNDFIVNGPAIIVGRKGSAGKVVWEDKDCFPIDTTYWVKLTDQKKTELKYIYFILKALNLQNLKGGTGIPGLNRQDVYAQFQVPLPPLEVQKEIVAELDSYQKVIDGARQVVENWKPRIKINPDWPKVKLGEVSQFIDYRGKTPTKTKTGIPLITAKNVKKGYIQNEPREFISPEGFDSWMTRGIPSKGDILITTEAPLGNVAQINTDNKIALAQRLITLIPDRKILLDSYVKEILLTDFMQKRLITNQTGSTVYGIKAKTLKTIEIPLPSVDTQKQIVTEIEKEQKMVDECKKLIAIHERKIKDKIAEVWGEES